MKNIWVQETLWTEENKSIERIVSLRGQTFQNRSQIEDKAEEKWKKNGKNFASSILSSAFLE